MSENIQITDLPEPVSVDAKQAEPVKGGLNVEQNKATDALLAPPAKGGASFQKHWEIIT